MGEAMQMLHCVQARCCDCGIVPDSMGRLEQVSSEMREQLAGERPHREVRSRGVSAIGWRSPEAGRTEKELPGPEYGGRPSLAPQLRRDGCSRLASQSAFRARTTATGGTVRKVTAFPPQWRRSDTISRAWPRIVLTIVCWVWTTPGAPRACDAHRYLLPETVLHGLLQKQVLLRHKQHDQIFYSSKPGQSLNSRMCSPSHRMAAHGPCSSRAALHPPAPGWEPHEPNEPTISERSL